MVNKPTENDVEISHLEDWYARLAHTQSMCQDQVEVSRLEDLCARLAHTQSMCQDQYEMRYLEMQLEEAQLELEQKRQEMRNE